MATREMTWEFVYRVGNTYKCKRVNASSVEQAFKRARLGNSVIDLNIVEFVNGEWHIVK